MGVFDEDWRCWRCVECNEHRAPARPLVCEDPGDWVCRDCAPDKDEWDRVQEFGEWHADVPYEVA